MDNEGVDNCVLDGCTGTSRCNMYMRACRLTPYRVWDRRTDNDMYTQTAYGFMHMQRLAGYKCMCMSWTGLGGKVR